MKIFSSVEELRKHCDEHNEVLVATSGGFDPMHVGHLRCIQGTADHAKWMKGQMPVWANKTFKVVVIVNGDGFLNRKKGYAFMPEAERMEIIAGVAGVDYVVPWDDGSQTVTDALKILRPVAFTKGGDRDAAANVPEFDLCKSIDCWVVFNVGGGKIQSSSALVERHMS
jgi:glycerol-3-phosphate cytidylyltransferase-like family protein